MCDLPLRISKGPHCAQIRSTGRGGAGNIRSPSRDATKGSDHEGKAYEEKVLRDHIAAEEGGVVSRCHFLMN
jgi:hypothetical protein